MRRICLFAVLFIFALSSCSAHSVTVSVPSQYQTVSAGNPVYIQTEVKWPENTGKVDLVIEYTVKDAQGTEVAYLKVLKAIETQISYIDSINIPSGTQPGLYTIHENVSYPIGSFPEVVASFNVTVSAQQHSNNLLTTYLFVIIGIVGFIAILALVEVTVLVRKNKKK